MKKFSLFFVLFLSFFTAFSQDVEMADTMRSNGKIYVVIGVIMIIFLGIIGYLISLDKKIGKLEKELEK